MYWDDYTRCLDEGYSIYKNPPIVEEESTIEDLSFGLQPNPATHSFTIILKGKLGKGMRYEMLDVFGKLTSKNEINSSSTVIFVNDLVSGIYFVELFNANNMRVGVKKLIINVK